MLAAAEQLDLQVFPLDVLSHLTWSSHHLSAHILHPYTAHKGRLGTPQHPQGTEAGTVSLAQAHQEHPLLDAPSTGEPLQPLGQGMLHLGEPREMETARDLFRDTGETK